MGLTQERMTGGCGEAIVAAEFLKRGIPVYYPAVDTGADLVVDIGGSLQRVQVKSTRSPAASIPIHLCRRNHKRGTSERGWIKYENGGLDWYAVCCVDRGYTALVPADKAGLRITFGADRLKEIEIGAVIDRLLEGCK